MTQQAQRFNRLWSLILGVSIRTKIMGMIVGLTILLGLGITLQVRAAMHQTLSLELEHRGISIGRDLAARSTDPILIHDTFALYQLLRDTVTNNPDLRYAFILDENGQVLVHSFTQDGADPQNSGFPLDLLAINRVASHERYRHQILQTNEGIVHDFAVPIFEGRAGTARVGLSENRLNATVNAVTGQLVFTTLAVALISIAAAAFLTWLLTRPILDLVSATRAVAQGHLNQKAPRWADDEIGTLSDAFNQMVADLATAQAEREAYNRELGQLLDKVIHAQEEERQRIARELHDETGQALTSFMVGLKVLERANDVEEMRQHAAELRQMVARALEDVRNLALELRPSTLDDKGLIPTLARYTHDYSQKFGIEVDFHARGFDGIRLPSQVETALYRIVQEALTNVARHAHADTVSVLLERQTGANRLLVIIEDNGCGFRVDELLGPDMQEKRLGLFGMRERANLIGGELIIESQPGAGTTIFVNVPLNSHQVRRNEFNKLSCETITNSHPARG